MSVWTLEHDGTTQTLTEWGADDSATLTFTNQQAGSLTLHFPGMADADVPFAYKDKIILRRDSTIVFRGHAMPPKRAGEGISEGITIQFVDAWWYLTIGNITQDVWDETAISAPRVGTIVLGSPDITVVSAAGIVVGMTVIGAGIAAGAKVIAISGLTVTMDTPALNNASVNLYFTLGSKSTLVALFLSANLGLGYTPASVATSLQRIVEACDNFHGGGIIQMGTCYGTSWDMAPLPVDIMGTFATAIIAVLHYVPDAVPWFDYSTDPPSLNFTQRGAATVKEINANGEPVQSDIIARKDLVMTGVRLFYRGYLINGLPTTSIDTAGDTLGPGVLMAEFQLNPPSQLPYYVPPVSEKQYIEVDPIDITSKDWWIKNVPLPVEPEDLVIGDGCKLELDPDAPENAGAEDLTDVGGCTNRIMEGNIPTWLNVDAHLKFVRATGYLTFREYNDPADPGQGYTTRREIVEVNCAATDLSTNEYENTLVVGGWYGGTFNPELMPVGVAAKLLASLNVLHYQGSLAVTNDECDFDVALGRVLNITGQRTEWETMRAQIQGVSHRLHYGVTSFNFGPPNHLAPQDYLELQRRFQRQTPSRNLDTRFTGTIPGGGESALVSHPRTADRYSVKRRGNTTEQMAVDGAGQRTVNTKEGRQAWTDGTTTLSVDATGKFFILSTADKIISLNLDEIPSGKTAHFQPITICAGGVQKTATVLCTDPA